MNFFTEWVIVKLFNIWFSGLHKVHYHSSVFIEVTSYLLDLCVGLHNYCVGMSEQLDILCVGLSCLDIISEVSHYPEEDTDCR